MRIHQLKEGYEILSPIDREKYQERDGLEGPIMTRSGKVVYYDPKEGSYYDPDTDMYISYDDWKKLDSENMHKIDMEENDLRLPASTAGFRSGIRFRSGGKASGPVSKSTYDREMNAFNQSKTAPKPKAPKLINGPRVAESARGLGSIDWPDTDEDGDSAMMQHAENAIRHNMHAYDAYGHVYSMTPHRDWMEANKDDIIKMFAQYGLQTESAAKDWTDKRNWPIGIMAKHPKPEITQWYKWDGQQWISKGAGYPVSELDPEIEPFLDKQGAYEAERLRSMPFDESADKKRWKQTSMSPEAATKEFGKENVRVKKGALRNGDDMVEVFVESVAEEKEKPYICVHAKKGKHECHAGSSYEAAKKAAAHWKMKSTAGIDAHLAVEEGLTDVVKSVGSTFKRGFKSLTNRINRPAKPPQPNQHTKRVKPGGNRPSLAKQINWGGDYNESTENPAMAKALRSIEKTFGGGRSAINDQVTAMCRAADMLGSDRFKDRAFSVVEQYGINSKHELIQELHMMIKNEAAIDDDEIYGADTNIKMMKNAIAKLRKADESLGEETIKYEDEYDTPVVIEIDKDKFMYNGNPITKYDWNNSAKAILTPGMHQKAKSWEEVHQYLSRFLGNPAGLQSACRQVFDMNDEGCKVNEAVMVSEAQFDEAAGEKDACYHKVKSRYKVWPSAYASGALAKCRKVGAKNWGNSK